MSPWVLLVALLVGCGDLGAHAGQAGDLSLPYTSSVLAGGHKDIWQVGDSLTRGYPGTDGYRHALRNWFLNAGYNITFVGSLNDGSWSENAHDGHDGFTSSQIYTSVSTVYPGTVTTFNFVILYAGMNDMGVGYNATTAINDYTTLLNWFIAQNPSVRVVVTTLNPHQNSPQKENIIDFNSRLPAVWNTYDAAHPSYPLIRANIWSAFGGVWKSTLFFDQTHPNQDGYIIIAKELARAIGAAT